MNESVQSAVTVVAVASVLVVLVCATLWLFSRLAVAQLAPIAMILLGFCVDMFFPVKQPYLQMGLQIYPNDVISLLLLMAATLSFALRPVPVYEPAYLSWLGFGLVIIGSFLVGLQEHGRYAGTEVRPFIFLWAAGLYCAAVQFSEADFKRMASWCVWMAYAVIAIAIYYWVAVRTGFVDRQEVFEEPDTQLFRPVKAGAALFMASVGLVQTLAWLRRSGTRWAGLHAAVALAFVVIIQHRSVWVPTAIGLATVFWLERRRLPERFGILLTFGLVVTLGLAMAAAFGALDDLGWRIQESAEEMGRADGTFAARVDGWIRLTESWLAASPAVWLFGFPFGQGFTRMHYGQLVSWDPHNFYLHLVLRVGIVGAILFLLPTFGVIVHGLSARCTSESEYLRIRGLAVVLLVTMIYCTVYQSNAMAGAATGIAIAEFIRRRQQQQLKNPLRPEGRERSAARTPPTWYFDR
jgi:hypothetical protein